MAYQSWSVVAFEQPTASKWNILGTNDSDFNTRLNSLEGYNDINFYANMSGNQTVSDTTDTTVEFDTEKFDTGSDYNTGTYTFTAPQAGLYLFFAQVSWSGTSDQDRTQVKLVTNSADHDAHVRTQHHHSGVSGESGTTITPLKLATNDTVYVQAWHDHGTNATLLSGERSTFFAGFMITEL